MSDNQSVGGPARKNMRKTSGKKRFEPVNQANYDDYFTIEVGITVSRGQRTSWLHILSLKITHFLTVRLMWSLFFTATAAIVNKEPWRSAGPADLQELIQPGWIRTYVDKREFITFCKKVVLCNVKDEITEQSWASLMRQDWNPLMRARVC